MIISGGVNIYPQEIENALVEHPKVLDACVIGLPDNEMGEIVTAVIDPGTEVDGDDALATELLDYLSERIAKYKLPRRIEFAHDLPRTPTGKLVKRTLKERFANTSVR
jgi:fatty-acyl-CoA synthase